MVLADAAQRLHVHRQAGRLQLPGGLPGQLFGKTALAGKADQPRRRVTVIGAEALAGIAYLTLFTAAVEVQQPAGDEEQRHEQRADGEDDPPHQAEVTAGVQCINAGQQLSLEAFAGVAVVGFHLPGRRVQVDLVQRAVVGRIFQQVKHRGRLPGDRWHADVVGAQAWAGAAVDAAPDRLVVGHRRRALRRRAAFAHPFVLRGVGQQLGKTPVVPFVGPGQARQRRQQIEQQAPGAEHRVQVPIETAALFAPVQGQPRAPARHLARPAQVQAGETEEQQNQRAGPGDLPAGVAHREEAVQLQDKPEHVLADGVAHVGAGVGIEVPHLAAPFTRRWGEEHARGAAAVGFHPEHRHGFAFAGFELAHQLGGRQYPGLAFFHAQYAGVERTQ